ncbi:hypothetical protein VB776_07195 [Arcicella sp. DC2W]|uniref:DUF2326 domain-containing protein n=1 Tax=Arcicella gelida TaxID=2984195 RepID=A0ABU5S2L3_9BACT|nr:hypothetical protein [Arcicella sp. DC2W]MEA5402692.1 hypothetical protein [Arcicella sp. DC2W]
MGLSLIVDNTPLSIYEGNLDEKGNPKTGNNVGKTTFLRCIDFCLGSDGKDIYTGGRKRDLNQGKLVHSFLMEQEVIFELIVGTVDGESITIRRSLIPGLDLFIDGKQYSKLDSFKEGLNELFFGIKPKDKVSSFRNMIKKFIRIDTKSQSDEFDVIVSGLSYNIEAIFLHLFGFPDIELLSKRVNLKIELKSVSDKLSVFKKQFKVASLKASTIQIEKDIEEAELEVKNFNLPKSYDELHVKYKELKDITTNLSSKIGALNTKLMLSENTLADLKNSESKIDPNAVKMLYEEASVIIPNIQKTFEEVLDFHNSMVKSKIQFVENHISRIKFDRGNLQKELNEFLKEQNKILKLIDEKGGFNDLLIIREKLNKLFNELGDTKGKIEVVESLMAKESELKLELEALQNSCSEYLEKLNSNIQKYFNKYFSDYTKRLYDTNTFVYYDDQTNKFGIDFRGESPSDGFQKARIIAFDLSFIGYYNELELGYPRFSIQDKVELIHINQLKTIFQICEGINGQLIIPVLREVISKLGDEFIDKHKILDLSQESKFFDIESTV